MSEPPATVLPVPTTYRERLAQFKILEEKRFELIEELLDKLEKTEAKLAQTELDLNSEQNVRRTLQAEVVEAKDRESALAQKQSRRPFVLVLIDADADGFLFQDKFITRRAQGGEALADELLVRTREYLRPQFEDADTLDIIVRVYANLEGMANYLVRQDKVRNLGQLRAFATGFCGRISSFDFVDTGVGKEGSSARKVRENLSFYTSNTHLRHVILALSPADLPTSLLSTLPLDKITLVETLPIPATITSLPIKITRYTTLFLPPPSPKSPKPRGRNGTGTLQLMQQEDADGGATWLVIQPERSKSQGAKLRRRGGSEDGDSSLSISIGPDNTVSVDSGRRRRIMS
ncbi:hypothetical protein K458DRAFT_61161 [Lentithecium fluviatile CBS 122367]|uniref:DUF7923 domain-containing protein n=1 Tax=Lentithecium fluviatile CBS 122367 TaxID=1168545 RepID=A0A6G1JK78_9PLEO|nr:hypothetical protein K458DRAFT_61161 [Lentithecium fluviatile CBS 122367]